MSAESPVSFILSESSVFRRALRNYRRVSNFAATWLPSIVIILGILGVWEGYVRLFDVPKWLLPAPSVVGATIVEDIGLLSRHTWVTLKEVVIGFGFALASGVLIAIGIALSRTVERAIYPFVIASQTIPVIAIAPLLLIWVGYGLTPKIMVVALIAFFPIAVNTIDGLKSIDPDTVNLMRTLGANRLQILVKAQLPAAMPFLFSGARIAVA
ncbi:MAG: ABC transporter permease, partial [Chloroflexi bacterium]|nr:ABC transporter permease [Chloroflexota bacterium]